MPTLETRDGTRLFYTDWRPERGPSSELAAIENTPSAFADVAGASGGRGMLREGGDGPVVFVHGLALGSEMWEYQRLDLCERGVRTIAYDQRGCGRSDQPGHGYEFDALADDLAAVLEHLDLRGATLVGFSLGAGVITRCLARYGAGERVARVAFVCSTTPYLLKGPDNPDGVERSLIYNTFRAGLQRDRPGLFAAITPAFFGLGLPGVELSPESVAWAVRLGDSASPKATWDLYRVANETDLRPDLAAITVPTLVIHGDSDAFAPVAATGARTAAAIPCCRLEVYENAAHGLFLTHKDRLSADLLAFARG